MPRICDYEGSTYRTDFWEGQNREYEDQAERIALQRMLPPRGNRLIEVGAGFGRLVDLYDGYDQIILTDYARTQLQEAQSYLGHDDRFIFVVADIYKMPFVDNLFDALTMIRVMHHLTDVPAALIELYRILNDNGTAIIEHANKRHLKSLARWLMKRQDWNPLSLEPLEFVDLNFDFHPKWIKQQCETAGFTINKVRSLSYYRLDLLKRRLPTSWLIALERLTQPTGQWWQLSPSIFLQAKPQKTGQSASENFFQCPNCHTAKLIREPAPADSAANELLACQDCRYRWALQDGIYDFKTPFATP